MDTILSSIMAIVSARTRDNARTPMQWSAGRSAGFSAGEPWIKLGENHEAINAEEQLERGDSVFAFTRELLRLRREDPCLSEGRLFPCEDKPGVLAYERRTDNRSVLVVCNLTAEDQRYPCPEGYAGGRTVTQRSSWRWQVPALSFRSRQMVSIKLFSTLLNPRIPNINTSPVIATELMIIESVIVP